MVLLGIHAAVDTVCEHACNDAHSYLQDTVTRSYLDITRPVRNMYANTQLTITKSVLSST